MKKLPRLQHKEGNMKNFEGDIFNQNPERIWGKGAIPEYN